MTIDSIFIMRKTVVSVLLGFSFQITTLFLTIPKSILHGKLVNIFARTFISPFFVIWKLNFSTVFRIFESQLILRLKSTLKENAYITYWLNTLLYASLLGIVFGLSSDWLEGSCSLGTKSKLSILFHGEH